MTMKEAALQKNICEGFHITSQALNSSIENIICSKHANFAIPSKNWFNLLILIIILVTILGNIMVVLAVVKNRYLQNTTNFFLSSLAVADLLVGLIVMPICLMTEIMGYFPFGFKICHLWIFSDVLLCTSSIWHMCVMSIDRFFTIRFPLKYGRNKKNRYAVLKVFLVWILSILISIPLIYLGISEPNSIYSSTEKTCAVNSSSYKIYGSIFAFYIPLILIAITYFFTMKSLKYLMNSKEKELAKLLKAKLKNNYYSCSLLPRCYRSSLTQSIINKDNSIEYSTKNEPPCNNNILGKNNSVASSTKFCIENEVINFMSEMEVYRNISLIIKNHSNTEMNSSQTDFDDSYFNELHGDIKFIDDQLSIVNFELSENNYKLGKKFKTFTCKYDLLQEINSNSIVEKIDNRKIPIDHNFLKSTLKKNQSMPYLSDSDLESIGFQTLRKDRSFYRNQSLCSKAKSSTNLKSDIDCEKNPSSKVFKKIEREMDEILTKDGNATLSANTVLNKRRFCLYNVFDASVEKGKRHRARSFISFDPKEFRTLHSFFSSRSDDSYNKVSPVNAQNFKFFEKKTGFYKASNERKAFRVLMIIFLIFFVSWTPFFIVNLFSAFYKLDFMTPTLFSLITWLGYSSSMANPAVYTIFNKTFRHAFLRLLMCKTQYYDIKRKELLLHQIYTHRHSNLHSKKETII